jgi:hypothetical protein
MIRNSRKRTFVSGQHSIIRSKPRMVGIFVNRALRHAIMPPVRGIKRKYLSWGFYQMSSAAADSGRAKRARRSPWCLGGIVSTVRPDGAVENDGVIIMCDEDHRGRQHLRRANDFLPCFPLFKRWPDHPPPAIPAPFLLLPKRQMLAWHNNALL